jgi:hypothetical protein
MNRYLPLITPSFTFCFLRFLAASIAFWMTLRAVSMEEICVFGNWFDRIVHSKEGSFEPGRFSLKKDSKEHVCRLQNH